MVGRPFFDLMSGSVAETDKGDLTELHSLWKQDRSSSFSFNDFLQIGKHSFSAKLPDRGFPEVVETFVKDGIQVDIYLFRE